MVKRILVLLMVLLLSTSVCFAKADEWESNTYDFSKIETILLLPPFVGQSVNNPFAYQKTTDYLMEEIRKQNIKWVDLHYVVEQVEKETNINMTELLEQDVNKFLKVLEEYGPHHVDAVLRIDVFSYGWSTQFVEGYYTPRMNQGNGTFTGFYNWTTFSGTYTAPVTSYNYIPGASEQIANAGCIFSLYDAKSLNMIWGYVDNRSKNTRAVKFAHPNAPINRMFKSHTSPDKLMQNVIEAAFEQAPFAVK